MVFLIDDDKSVRRGFGIFLKSAGLEFQSYESADAFTSSVHPDVDDKIILDLNLPGTSGCDFLKGFRANNTDTAVIVVTAFDDPQTRRLCSEYGVKAYLRKPVDGEILIDLINLKKI